MKMLNYTKNDAVVLDEVIENAGNVKITSGPVYTIIFIDGIISCGLFFNKKKKVFEFKKYSKDLIEEIISALGEAEDLGAEKLIATLLLYEFANEF